MKASRPDALTAVVELEPSGYRPVSRLAVGALVLGMFSALSVVSPLFLIVPLMALAVAVAAFADVDREGAPKAGRLAAVAGLALAVGFGAQTVTSGIVKRSLASRRAVAAGEIFLQAVREGRTADAQGMCGPEAREQVATLSACAARSECRGARAGDEPGTWFVQIVPGASGGCTARLVLASGPGAQQGKPFERWLVTACEIEGVGITPSGT